MPPVSRSCLFSPPNAERWAFSIATRVGADYLRKPEHRVAIADVDEAADALPDSGSRWLAVVCGEERCANAG
jgi:DNA-directed RNA polymerase specialized sigma24 family protein